LTRPKVWLAWSQHGQATKADLLDVCNELRSALEGTEWQYQPRNTVPVMRAEMRRLLTEVVKRLAPPPACPDCADGDPGLGPRIEAP